MNDEALSYPKNYNKILHATQKLGFEQLSDGKTGSVLATLCASKPRGKFLELGTGTGLCTSWMLKGMCDDSTLVTVDNDEKLVELAKKYLLADPRLEFVVDVGENLINKIGPSSLDLIFADTWPGKYNHLNQTLNLLKVGGFYLIDDMLPQVNWPEGHEAKSRALISSLLSREDLIVTQLAWSTGLLLCVKTS